MAGLGYFWSLRESKKVSKQDFHIEADLVKGTDDNYRSLGQSWPDSRYLVISLSGEVEPNRHHGQIRSLDAWRCTICTILLLEYPLAAVRTDVLTPSGTEANRHVRSAAGFPEQQREGDRSRVSTRGAISR
jgi:hypothetical protein